MSAIEESKMAQATDDAVGSKDDSQHELPNEETQRGVQDIEAVTLSWTKLSLILVFLK